MSVSLDEHHSVYTCVRDGCGRQFRVEKWLHDGKEGQPKPHPRYQYCTVCRNEWMLGIRDLIGFEGEPGAEFPEDKRHYPVGPGWVPIILELHEQLTELVPTYQISQIKEKFGTLRFYADGVTEEGNHLIYDAEALSARTCEYCGAPGKPRDGGWVKTLCDEHAEKRERDRKP